jgi:hypothetical protein
VTIEPWKKKVEIFRSRFVARTDRFLIRKPQMVQRTNKETGELFWKEETFAMPACSNFGDQSICLMVQKPKGRCIDCSHRIYAQLSDEMIWKHLSGEQEIILLPLCQEGIRFGAVDFDKGTVFEDAKAMRDLSMSLGIPCYIAKSTSKGYHLYWFFKEFVEPCEFASYIRYLFEELAFYLRYQSNPGAGLPEVFPKQVIYSNTDTGNGIKVPMMDPRMREGRNCWMDDLEQPIPLDKQWAYLEATQLIEKEAFKRLLVEKDVEILKAPASKDRQKARVLEGKEAGPALRVKPFGDFWSIVEGCPAMREYWMKDEKGSFVWDATHHTDSLLYEAYLASLMLAVTTTNGVEEVRKRWPDRDTDYQLSYIATQGYTPYSCATMQLKNVCIKKRHPKIGGDHCLEKIQPVEYIHGVRTPNPDKLPEEQWPEPSPVRFAADRHLSTEDIIERLAGIFRALKARSKPVKDAEAEYLPPNPEERIKALFRCARDLGPEEYQRVETYVTSNKFMKVGEIKAQKKEFEKEKAEKKDKDRHKSGKSFTFGNNEFFLRNNCYYRSWRDAKGIKMEAPISNFHVQIHEELGLIRVPDGEDLCSAEAAEDRTFRVTVYVGAEKISFDANFREWTTSPDAFFKTLLQHAGSKLWYNRSDYDHIRNCINAFSQDQIVNRKVSRQIGYHLLKGREVYIMPSVLVDKEAIVPNEEFGVEAFVDDFSKSLDFQIISEEEFKDLANHIVNDYFACNNPVLTMTTFAHAMACCILPQVELAVGYNKSPTLWLGGSFARGKSFIAEAAQNFFGVFKMNQSASGTAKSKLANGYNCRHAFMLIDDYKKKLVDQWGIEMPQLIQQTYDRTGRAALERSGIQRKKVDRMRGLMCVTGEDSVENESSAVSRLIVVDVPFNENMDAGGRVKTRRDSYNGFTPYFIQFILGLSREEIKEVWDEYYNSFFKPVETVGKQRGPNRICENLTLNMVAFRLCMDMLAARGAIPEVKRDELCRQQQKNLTFMRGEILSAVGDASGAAVFLNGLKEICQDAAHYEIVGWPGTLMVEKASGCKPIGFWRHKTPGIIYVYPKTAHGIVSEREHKNNTTIQGVSHVARQLFEEGWLDTSEGERDGGRYTVHMRSPNKTLIRVWPLKCEALGFEIPAVTEQKTQTRRESSGNQGALKIVSPDKKD